MSLPAHIAPSHALACSPSLTVPLYNYLHPPTFRSAGPQPTRQPHPRYIDACSPSTSGRGGTEARQYPEEHLAAMRCRPQTPLPDPLRLRTGLNLVPAVGVVLGALKLFYCLRCDTINTAARLANLGGPSHDLAFDAFGARLAAAAGPPCKGYPSLHQRNSQRKGTSQAEVKRSSCSDCSDSVAQKTLFVSLKVYAMYWKCGTPHTNNIGP